MDTNFDQDEQKGDKQVKYLNEYTHFGMRGTMDDNSSEIEIWFRNHCDYRNHCEKRGTHTRTYYVIFFKDFEFIQIYITLYHLSNISCQHSCSKDDNIVIEFNRNHGCVIAFNSL